MDKGLNMTFLNVMPVNSLEEGVLDENFDGIDASLRKYAPKLIETAGAKNLHVVSFEKLLGNEPWELLPDGKKIKACKNAPNYLLGLCKQVPKNEMMPAKFRSMHIIGLESDNTPSIFKESLPTNYLRVHFGGVCNGVEMPEARYLTSGNTSYGYFPYWTFLAEEI